MKSKKQKGNNGSTFDEMPLEEQARWLCLLEAVTQITAFADRSGIDTDKSSKWIKCGAMNRFIADTYPSMRLRLEHESQGYVFD